VTLLTGFAGRPGRRTRRGPGLAGRLDALDEVLALAGGRLDDAAVAEARRIAAKAGDRLRFGEAHTVVALAGTTGSGKSSLFNALAGETLSQVGMRRPTTGTAHAAVWGSGDAGPLLDWLDVPRRHVLGDAGATGDADLEGLVLLDLPDVDSVDRRHRLAADRLVELVDVLVWVLDPQKYADAAVHDRYLAPLAGHAGVMVAVLNQSDRLPPAALAGCLADLGALLRREGLDGVPVLPASARTGAGLEELRAELAARVAVKRASVRRLEADLAALAGDLGDACGDGAERGGVGRAERDTLVSALTDAAGVDVVAGAVARSYRLRARRATGWPVTRWTSRLRLDPTRRFRLRETPSDLVRTSLPGASAVQRARVDRALRELGASASGGLAEPWPGLVRRAATASQADLPDLLDRAVAGADLGVGRRPRWWRLVGVVQYLLAATALAGLLWLSALFAVAWLRLPEPPVPDWGPLPVPTVLLVGGVALGLVLAGLGGLWARAGARRAAHRARREVAARVAAVAEDAVITPVEEELAAQATLCRAVSELSRP
jgi:energy-coupling factor transporter ATP-binding protein EcfA2